MSLLTSKATITRYAAIGATAATLLTGMLNAGLVSAKEPVQLTINPNTLEAKAPANFTPSEDVGIWYNLPDGTAVNFETITAQADGSLDWVIPVSDYMAIPSNAVNLVVDGWQSNTEAVYTFDHTALPPAALTIDAQSLEAKAPANFFAGEEVAVWYNLPDGTAVNLETTTALADGSLDWTIASADYAAIPTNAVNIVAQGFASNHQAIYTFTH